MHAHLGRVWDQTNGVLAVQSTGRIVLQMTLDTTGCHVQLLHEGGVLSLG